LDKRWDSTLADAIIDMARNCDRMVTVFLRRLQGLIVAARITHFGSFAH
jgi:hypothetical protein